jgi:hypothetical protein
MNLEELKKIIKEEVENAIHGTNLNKMSNRMLHDIHYIKLFSLAKYSKKDGVEAWKFSHKANDYIIIFYVVKEGESQWRAKLEIFWKEETDGFTSDSGKDMEKEFGPYNDYEKMVTDLDLKLKNNPLISTQIYNDDWNANMDELLKDMIIKLRNKHEDLVSMDSDYFDDLKRVYEKTKGLDEQGILNFCKNEYPTDSDKQTAIMELQKMEKISFHKDMKKMY